MDDTKIIYHIDDEETPYLVKIAVCPNAVTLGDFKNALNRPNYKFFFKSVDADFGVVKEEIADDDARLPCFNGKVISWLVSADSSTKSDNHSTGTGENHLPGQNKNSTNFNKAPDNIHSVSKNEIPSEQEQAIGTTGHGLEECDTCVETDSVYSGDRVPPLKNFHNYKHGSRLAKLGQRIQNYETSSSMMSSDLESTSFFDSEDESSRFSTATGTTMSSAKYPRHRRQRRHRRILPIRRTSEDATSFSSVTDSTMSLNIITVTLNMDSVNFLGISIVGQSNKAGDGGIYVGSIMRGGAVAQDGRIEPGDMILEVNRISFEDMSNDEAVRVLREEVQKPGPITLVVAKCWDPSPKNYFTIPRQEPVRPIDPRAWVLHTNAMTGALGTPGFDGNTPFFGSGSPAAGMAMIPGHFMGMTPSSGLSVPSMPPGMPPLILPPSMAGINAIPSSNMTTKSLPEVADGDGGGYHRSRGPASSGVVGGPGSTKTNGSRSGGETTVDAKGTQSLLSGANGKSSTSLTVASDMASVVHDMLMSDSGLEIRDRTWLKITIPNAFIGSELVDWLFTHVDGFADRRDARRYASNLLHYGYICHTVNKSTFSEQCYYTFGDIATTLSHLNLDEVDSVSEIGANSSSHTGTHPMMPQMYPHVHHVLPDAPGSGSATGLSSVQNQNAPPNPNLGLMSSPIPGEGNSLAQTNSHYPYPPVLYPIPSAAPVSSSGPCNIDANGNDCSFVNPNSSALPSLRNRMSNNGQMGVDSAMYPVNTTTMPSHTRSVIPNQTHITTMNATSNQRIQQQKVNNSSSSSSSRSSASSTSSSSTGYSGNRCPAGLSANSTTQTININVPQSMTTPLDTSASKGLPSFNKGIQRRTDPSSVQSLSVSSHPCFCMPFIRKTLNSSSHANNNNDINNACKKLDTQQKQQQEEQQPYQTKNVAHDHHSDLHEQDSAKNSLILLSDENVNNNKIVDNKSSVVITNTTISTTPTNGNRRNSYSVKSLNQQITNNVIDNDSITTLTITATNDSYNNNKEMDHNDNDNNNTQLFLLTKRDSIINDDFSTEHVSFMEDKIHESGTSSTSSASRQNGTGASAAGSGSGSAVTTHVLKKFNTNNNSNNNNSLTNRSECLDNVQRTQHGMDFTNAFRQTNCNLVKESNNKPEINQSFNHTMTTGGIPNNQR